MKMYKHHIGKENFTVIIVKQEKTKGEKKEWNAAGAIR